MRNYYSLAVHRYVQYLQRATICGLSIFGFTALASTSPYSQRQAEYLRQGLSGEVTVYKKLGERHRPVKAEISYHFKGGYFIEGLGYVKAGFGLYLNPQLIQLGHMSERALDLPEILLRRIHSFSLGEGTTLDYATTGFRVRGSKTLRLDTAFERGELFLVAHQNPEAISSSGKSCTLSDQRPGVLQYVGPASGGQGERVLYASLKAFAEAEEIEAWGTCRNGDELIIATKTLQQLNKTSLVESLRFNAKHQNKQMDLLLGAKRTLPVTVGAKLQICSGGLSGYYYDYANQLASRLPVEDQAKVLATNGSNDNLAAIGNGICPVGLVQKDAYMAFRRKNAGQDLAALATPLFEEQAFLICKKEFSKASSVEIDVSDRILIGAKNSGAELTFEELAKTQKGLAKARTENIGGQEALKKLLEKPKRIPVISASLDRAIDGLGWEYLGFLRDGSLPDCMFHVSHPQAPIIQMAQSFPELKLVPVDATGDVLDASNISPADLGLLSEGEQVATVSTPTLLAYDPLWASSDAESFAKLSTQVEQMISGANLQAEARFRLCTGSSLGYYSALGKRASSTLWQEDIQLVYTNGSQDNIAKLAAGECDFALAQRNVVDSSGIELQSQIVGEEKLHLICHADSGVQTFTDLNNSHIVHHGAETSGTALSFSQVVEVAGLASAPQSSALSGPEALRSVIENPESCLLQVSHFDEARKAVDLVGYAELHPQLRLASIMLPAIGHNLTVIGSSLLPGLTESRDIESLSTPILLIASPGVDAVDAEKQRVFEAIGEVLR